MRRLIPVVRQPALAPDRVPRAVRERVLARARVARLPGLAADEVQDEDVLDAERFSSFFSRRFRTL